MYVIRICMTIYATHEFLCICNQLYMNIYATQENKNKRLGFVKKAKCIFRQNVRLGFVKKGKMHTETKIYF